MAQISRDVFSRVVAYDPYLIDGDFPVFVERVPTLDALARDRRAGVAAHAAQQGDARHDRRGFFAAMPRGGYLVNTARGASSTCRRSSTPSTRGTWQAPASTCCPSSRCRATPACVGHPRVVLTPHSAFYSVEAERELRRKAAQNLATWLATGRPEYVVSAGTRVPPG